MPTPEATGSAEKVRENRLRRAAERQGLQVTKSRRRDPRALDYGKYFVSNLRTNTLECGEQGLDIDELETFLDGGPETGE